MRFDIDALNRKDTHFLHIGKNAGTQFKFCAAQVNAFSFTHNFILHPHRDKLWHLPEGAQYTFCVRDPIKRFVSGFYSRKRKGQPRIYSEWSRAESLYFPVFEHANDLAESLSEGGALQKQAEAAIRSILHVSNFQCGWFYKIDNFLEKRPPVHILKQESFNADLLKLYELLGIEETPVFAEGSTRSHRNDYSNIPSLSETAVENLRQWYELDYNFIALCDAWRESRGLA